MIHQSNSVSAGGFTRRCIILLVTATLSLSFLLYLIIPIIPHGPNIWRLPFPTISTHDPEFELRDRTLLESPSVPYDRSFEDVAVILKTGAGELTTRLRTHLQTVSSVVPRENLLLFADASADVEGYRVRDVLADLAPAYKSLHPEFETYFAQLRTLRSGSEIRGSSHRGWELDKHKFLPMVSKAYSLLPDKSWYIFVEADTFVFWESILSFLETEDPNEPLYFGSSTAPTRMGHAYFAHGGSGFVLSRGALSRLTADESDYGAPGTHQFGFDLRRACCGDAVLADVLLAKGISVQGYYPLFSGEVPTSLAFGGPHGLWCEPLGTLHHLQEEELVQVWKWARSRPSGVMRYWQFLDYLLPGVKDGERITKNGPAPANPHVRRVRARDARECSAKCRQDLGCMHYQWHGTCELSSSIQLGHEVAPDLARTKRWRAEFELDRIEHLYKSQRCASNFFNHTRSATREDLRK